MDELGTAPLSEEEVQILAAYRAPRPAEWSLRSPALIVVDVTESFVGPDLPVAEAQRESPTACGENGWRAIEKVAPLLAAFRAAGAPVAFSGFGWLPSPSGVTARPGAGSTTLRPDVVVADLAPMPGEYEFVKIGPSAFFATALLTWLNTRGVDQVVVVGCTTSGCVRATVVDAYSYGLEVLLPHDGCFDRVETSHRMSLTDLDVKYARVLTCADVIAKLEGRV